MERSDAAMMHAITIHQPWASLIAIGAKPYETRAYPPPRKLIGQRIAVHAALRYAGEMYETLYLEHQHDALDAICEALNAAELDDCNWGGLPHGAVICTAILDGAYQCGEPSTAYHGVDCWTVRQCFYGSRSINSNIPRDHFGDYSPGRWAWRLTDVVALPTPIPARGKQGWWMWDETTAQNHRL